MTTVSACAYHRNAAPRVCDRVSDRGTKRSERSACRIFDYTYDTASNVISAMQAGTMGDTALEADRVYGYDTLDRVTHARYWDTQRWIAYQPGYTSTYEYDDLGNRISHHYRSSGAGAIAYEHDKANRMTTIDTVTQEYDNAGNVTLAYSVDRGTSYKYEYDHLCRLTAVYDDTGANRSAAFVYDALGRRVQFADDRNASTRRYYYDGPNEIVEYDYDGAETSRAYYVHGISYVDERLMMYNHDLERPFYYTLDRMYNVRGLVDWAGAFIERYCYDAYGRPRIRESCGRGDMNNDTDMDTSDWYRFQDAKIGFLWDPRADMDGDGDVDNDDQTAWQAKANDWPPTDPGPTVAQAFSDVDNPYMFQGVPHFALATNNDATEADLMLNHHRARFNDPVTGRWTTRDPLHYAPEDLHPRLPNQPFSPSANSREDRERLYLYLAANPLATFDPMGLKKTCGPRVWLYTSYWCIDEEIYERALDAAAGFVLCWWDCEKRVHKGAAAYVADAVGAGIGVGYTHGKFFKKPRQIRMPGSSDKTTLQSRNSLSCKAKGHKRLHRLLRRSAREAKGGKVGRLRKFRIAKSAVKSGVAGVAIVEAGVSWYCSLKCDD